MRRVPMFAAAAIACIVFVALTGCEEPEPAPAGSSAGSSAARVVEPAAPEVRFEAALKKLREVAPGAGFMVAATATTATAGAAPPGYPALAGARSIPVRGPGPGGKFSTRALVWLVPAGGGEPLSPTATAAPGAATYAGSGLDEHWFVSGPSDATSAAEVAEALRTALRLTVPAGAPPR